MKPNRTENQEFDCTSIGFSFNRAVEKGYNSKNSYLVQKVQIGLKKTLSFLQLDKYLFSSILWEKFVS